MLLQVLSLRYQLLGLPSQARPHQLLCLPEEALCFLKQALRRLLRVALTAILTIRLIAARGSLWGLLQVLRALIHQVLTLLYQRLAVLSIALLDQLLSLLDEILPGLHQALADLLRVARIAILTIRLIALLVIVLAMMMVVMMVRTEERVKIPAGPLRPEVCGIEIIVDAHSGYHRCLLRVICPGSEEPSEFASALTLDKIIDKLMATKKKMHII